MRSPNPVSTEYAVGVGGARNGTRPDVSLDWPVPVLVLLLPQAVVERVALGQQLRVRAAIADSAVLQHQDLVGVGHGGQAVRDADGRAALRGRLQRLQDRLQRDTHQAKDSPASRVKWKLQSNART